MRLSFAMSEPWPIHTVVFDLDDTLYPERDYVHSGFAAVGAFIESTYGVGGFQSTAASLFNSGLRGTVFDQALPQIGMTPTPGLIAELVSVYREHRPSLQLFLDAAEALQLLGQTFRLGLITDGFAQVQQLKIEALGLERLIPHRILTDTLGRAAWKPSTSGFLDLMRQCGGPPHGFLYIGDNAHKDFLPARALGWRTLRVQRPHGEHSDFPGDLQSRAEAVITSLLEVAPRLQLTCIS